MRFNDLTLFNEEYIDLGHIKSLDDLNDYVDEKISTALHRSRTNGEQAIYAVIPSSSQGNLTVFEITSDSESPTDDLSYIAKKKGQIKPGGDLISSPIIRGDVVVYGIQTEDGATAGEIRKLPGGEKLPGFNVSPPRPGFTYQRVMGGVEDTEATFSATPQEVPEPQLPATPATPANVNVYQQQSGVDPRDVERAYQAQQANVQQLKQQRDAELQDVKKQTLKALSKAQAAKPQEIENGEKPGAFFKR